MDRGAWWTTVHGVTRVRHDLETNPPPYIYMLMHMLSLLKNIYAYIYLELFQLIFIDFYGPMLSCLLKHYVT